MVKWEYKFTTSPTLQQDPDELNKLGSEGWDLCVVYPYADNIQTVILRRPKAAKDCPKNNFPNVRPVFAVLAGVGKAAKWKLFFGRSQVTMPSQLAVDQSVTMAP